MISVLPCALSISSARGGGPARDEAGAGGAAMRIAVVLLVAASALAVRAVSFTDSYVRHYEGAAEGKHLKADSLGPPSSSWFVYYGFVSNTTVQDDPFSGSSYSITLVGSDTDKFLYLLNGSWQGEAANRAAGVVFPACACPDDEQNLGLWTASLSLPDGPTSASMVLTESAVAGSLQLDMDDTIPIVAPMIVLPFTITLNTNANLSLATATNDVPLSDVITELYILDGCPETPQDRPSWAFLSLFSFKAPDTHTANMTLPYLPSGEYQMIIYSAVDHGWTKDVDLVHVSLNTEEPQDILSSSDLSSALGVPTYVWYLGILGIAVVAIISILSLIGIYFIRRKHDYEAL